MTSEWKECTIGEIATISAGGDKPKICSDIRTENIPIPIFSNGLENNGLYGYTDKAKIEGDTVTILARGVNVGTVCYRSEPFLPIVRLLYHESARARMRIMIKKLLKSHRYPPEKMDDAVTTVMQQCELWADSSMSV